MATEYKDLVKAKDKLRGDVLVYIAEKIDQQHGGFHELDPDSETFYEAGIETNDMIVTTVFLNEDYDLYYRRRDWHDENDDYYIGGMSIDDLMYIASLYS